MVLGKFLKTSLNVFLSTLFSAVKHTTTAPPQTTPQTGSKHDSLLFAQL